MSSATIQFVMLNSCLGLSSVSFFSFGLECFQIGDQNHLVIVISQKFANVTFLNFLHNPGNEL